MMNIFIVYIKVILDSVIGDIKLYKVDIVI